jgi:hypothetical protein
MRHSGSSVSEVAQTSKEWQLLDRFAWQVLRKILGRASQPRSYGRRGRTRGHVTGKSGLGRTGRKASRVRTKGQTLVVERRLGFEPKVRRWCLKTRGWSTHTALVGGAFVGGKSSIGSSSFRFDCHAGLSVPKSLAVPSSSGAISSPISTFT